MTLGFALSTITMLHVYMIHASETSFNQQECERLGIASALLHGSIKHQCMHLSFAMWRQQSAMAATNTAVNERALAA